MAKVVLVTGASRGIGQAIVNNLCNDGNSEVVVVGIARSEGPLSAIKGVHGDKFEYIVGDISDEKVLKKYVEYAIKKFGRIDAVVANAGVLEPVQDVNNIDVAQWKRLFDVNFFSIVSLVSLSLPHLKKVNGNIVFVSSGASTKPYYGWGAYGSSKAALNHFAQTIAAEEKGVKTVSVAPGVVDTQMQIDIREKFGPESMTVDALKRFKDLKDNNQLLDADIPGTIYANLALKGIRDDINGKYLRYSDALLEEYK